MTDFPTPLDPAVVERTRARLLATADQIVEQGPYAATAESLSPRGVPAWFGGAKLGIFVHWLPCSVAGFGADWYARTMYLPGTVEHDHHREAWGPQDEVGFKDLLPHFTGEHFDADDWLALVVRSGARYVVPVAEHHDGFSLSATLLSRWSATEIGPHRDVIGELRDAADRAGVILGVSSHRAENWWFYNGGRLIPSDVTDPEFRDLYGAAQPKATQPDVAFLDDWLARTVELVERHEPKILYFDWWIEEPAFAPYLLRLAAYYYNRVPDGVIHYKWDAFPEGAAVRDIERGSVATIQPHPFQNDTSTSRIAWSYLRDNEFKPLAEVLVDLVDVVSKNGCLMLNIGPLPDGTIDPHDRALLEGVGDWMRTNGEAIHGTTPWLVFGEGPTQQPVGSFVDTAPVPWTSADLRFTAAPGALYATFLAPPADGVVTVRSLGTTLRLLDDDVTDVELLGHGRLDWTRTADGLVVRIPVPVDDVPGTLKLHLSPVPVPERVDPEIA